MKKALALGLVLVLAMSVSALAASVDGSLKFEYDYEIEDDWTLTITPENGIPKAELVLNVKDEGWAFNAEIRRILEGTDTMQLRQIKANLDEPQVALTIWANGKETEDKKDPLEFIKSSKLQEGRDPKFRLEAGVFGVNAVVDYDSSEGEELLYGFLDTTVSGNKVGLAYLSDMSEGQVDDEDDEDDFSRSRTALVFGEMGFQGATVKVGAGMSFGQFRDGDEVVDRDDKNVLYGLDVKVPIPGYEVVAVQGKWRVAQEKAFSTFGSNKRVAELYALYQDSLIKGKAGVKGQNKAEYDADEEALTFLAEVTVREKDDGPDFDDVLDDYDLLTGYAVKAEVSRMAGKKWADNPLTRLYLGAGSKFMEGLFGMAELEYKSSKKDVTDADLYHKDLKTEDGKQYARYQRAGAEVSYDVGAGVTLIPFAGYEKFSEGLGTEALEW